MISFAAERLMEMEVGALTGAAYGEKSAERRAMATATAPGRPAPALWNCASPSCGPAAISLAFPNRGTWRRRRSRWSSRRLTSKASPPDRSTIWSKHLA
jgi:hypothetical protein